MAAGGGLVIASPDDPERPGSAASPSCSLLAAGLVTFSTDLTTADSFRGEPEAVRGQRLISQSFPAGSNAPDRRHRPRRRARRGRRQSRGGRPRRRRGLVSHRAGTARHETVGDARRRSLLDQRLRRDRATPQRGEARRRQRGHRRRADSRGTRPPRRLRSRQQAARPADPGRGARDPDRPSPRPRRTAYSWSQRWSFPTWPRWEQAP